jgi:large subunit ribosomal protein L10
MSKLVKQLMMDDLNSRLQDVGDIFVVSLGRLDAQKTTELRLTLRKKNISLQLIKNTLAKRVLVETPLEPALENLSGMLALCWGGEDVVDLAKELNRLASLSDFEEIKCRGGAMDGAKLDADDLQKVAKWPTRSEQLSILSGQMLSTGAALSGQLIGGGSTLAGQIASQIEKLENSSEETTAA